jgi:nucleotide-binding universal stress UspA family protein
LYHVLFSLPDNLGDFSLEADTNSRPAGARAWTLDHKKTLARLGEKIRRRLAGAGFTPDDLTLLVKDMELGIARDLLKECRSGYHSLIIGRRGKGLLRGVALGSVANKVLNQLIKLPLWIVGKGASPYGLLLALDGSANSWRAVEYLCRSPIRRDQDLTLYHVWPKSELASIPDGYLPERSNDITMFMDRAAQSLEKAGFRSGSISIKSALEEPSRAKAIVAQARESDCGTIIMGRWGTTESKAFALGRVTHKVSQLCRGQALWIIP